jgi:protein phosphatase
VDPTWIVLAGVGVVGAGLIAKSLVRRTASANGVSAERVGAKLAVEDAAPSAAGSPVNATVDARTRSEARSESQGVRTPREEPEVEDATGPIALILVTALGQTDRGRHRTTNEDSFLVDPKLHLFAICDGMGGHAAGEVASQLAIETIARAHRTATFDGEPDKTRPRRGDQLVRAILMANRAVYDKSREDPRYHGMGTTAVAARFSPNKQRVYIAHVGDSRCYRMRAGKLRQITKDHTLGSLGVQGPSAGKLVRAVGTELKVDVDLLTDAPEAGDYYMLCSDGLSRMVSNDAIEKILSDEKDLDAAVAKLIAAANEAGGRDNITVILVRVDEA